MDLYLEHAKPALPLPSVVRQLKGNDVSVPRSITLRAAWSAYIVGVATSVSDTQEETNGRKGGRSLCVKEPSLMRRTSIVSHPPVSRQEMLTLEPAFSRI